MATPTKYTYTISTSFPFGKVDSGRLTLEIAASLIVIGLQHIDTGLNLCDIWFKDVLSAGDQTILNAIVAAHSGEPLLASAQPVQFFSFAATQKSAPLKYGRAVGYVNTSSTANQAVRATPYAPPGADGQRSIVSSSANDTAAGTGARTVTIRYLTAAFVLKSETIALNGLTPVNTVNTDIAYIECIFVATVGSGQINQGVISLFTGLAGGGSVIASCAIGDQGTAYAHHYVPASVTCYVMKFCAGATVVAGVSNLVHQQSLATLFAPTVQIGEPIVHPAAGQWDHDYPIWLTLTGPDLIWVNEQPVAVTANKTWAGFEYVEF